MVQARPSIVEAGERVTEANRRAWGAQHLWLVERTIGDDGVDLARCVGIEHVRR